MQASLTVDGLRSTIRSRAGRAALAAALIASAGAPLLADSAPLPPRAARQEDMLWSRLRRIESAFRSGDAAALRGSFPAAARLRVDLPEVPGPASYGPGQMQVIFDRLFAGGATRAFTFDPDEVTRSSGGTVFARARWVRASAPGQGEHSHVLTFTLRQDGGDWRIHEILATP